MCLLPIATPAIATGSAMTLLNYIFELRTGDILNKNLTNANLLKRLLQKVLAKQPGGVMKPKQMNFCLGAISHSSANGVQIQNSCTQGVGILDCCTV